MHPIILRLIQFSIFKYIFFLIISFLLIGPIFWSSGHILGGDWNLPLTKEQMNGWFDNGAFTWTNQGNLFGTRQISLTAISFQLLVKLYPISNLNGDIFPKIFIVFVLGSAGFFMYIFARSLKLKEIPAILAGTIYITTPLFFDYLIMGWIYVLLSLAVFPLIIMFFIKSVQNNTLKDRVIVALLLSLPLQTQAIIWFFICFGLFSFYLVNDKRSLTAYFKSIVTIIILFLLLNFYWLFVLLYIPDRGITGSDIVSSDVSLGALTHFVPVNILRIFGSLYNFQFETIIISSRFILSTFLLPLIVFYSLLLKEKRSLIIPLIIISLFPFFLYILNSYRDVLHSIPFSNVIRDFARFTVLSTFSYSIIAAIVINNLWNKKNKLLIICIVLLWTMSISPWLSGELTNWEGIESADMRLRTKEFPAEYFEIEKIFSGKKLDQKAFYLPMGGTNDYIDDPKFHGAFQEGQDIFAGFSPVPGVLAISDRSSGHAGTYIEAIVNNPVKLYDILKPTNIRYFVIRKNMTMSSSSLVYRGIEEALNDKKIRKYYDSEKIVVFVNENYLPHFFTPQKTIVPENVDKKLGGIFFDKDLPIRSAVIFKDQNIANEGTLFEAENSQSTDKPILEFRKINPTKYRIRLHRAKGTFPLVFSESFHEEWKVYLSSGRNESMEQEFLNIDRYKMFNDNKEDQATYEEVQQYLKEGFVTALEGRSGKFLGKKEERMGVDFISKNFQGTIQNDNLPEGNFWETWSQKEVLGSKDHLLVNGYANAWLINVEEICNNETNCIKNQDGSFDMEFVIEYRPQKFFVIGTIFSGLVLIGCLSYLLYNVKKYNGIIKKFSFIVTNI